MLSSVLSEQPLGILAKFFLPLGRGAAWKASMLVPEVIVTVVAKGHRVVVGALRARSTGFEVVRLGQLLGV